MYETYKSYFNEDFERLSLVSIYHDIELQHKYLPDILPQVYSNPINRIILFVMQQLYKKNIKIDLINILLYIQEKPAELKSFIVKNKITNMPDKNILVDILLDINLEVLDISKFHIIYKTLYELAYKRFAEVHINNMSNSLNYSNLKDVTARAKAIVSINNILFGKANNSNALIESQLHSTLQMINSPDEYIPTFSTNLNKIIGGFTKGTISTIIAKSNHCKTTWCLYNAVNNILNGRVKSIYMLSTEEQAVFYWRRIISSVCNINYSKMRDKSITISNEVIDEIMKLFNNKLFIIENLYKFQEIVEFMYNINETDQIYLDHLQNITYPGNGNYLANMIGGIPSIISHQKQIAKQKKLNIVNLSQVNDKEIQSASYRRSKCPRYYDAYASSAMYQGSREYLALWYPIKDYEGAPEEVEPSPNELIMSVEKSSFTGTGKIKFHFDYTYQKFSDLEYSHNKFNDKFNGGYNDDF